MAKFHCVFSVTGDVNAPTRPHPAFSSLYKQRRAGYGEQEARRRRLLEEQRARRRNHADDVRKIAEGEEWEEEMEEEEEEENSDQVDASPAACEVSVYTAPRMRTPSPNTRTQEPPRKRIRRVHPYRNQLMMSEWLVDVPSDFTENWLVTVCPVGKRCLVVANRRTTKAYSRTGAFINCFPSLLPGGSSRTHRTSRDYCVLDCILHEPTSSFQVLDVLCWRGHPVVDSDREFRVYWLHTKLAETREAGERSKVNPYVFRALESFSCGGDAAVEGSMAHVLSKSWPLTVDGLLFFHKRGHYRRGRSPLVVWLKAPMVADLLGVEVSEEFLACAPQMSDPLGKPHDVTPLPPAAATGVEGGKENGEGQQLTQSLNSQGKAEKMD